MRNFRDTVWIRIVAAVVVCLAAGWGLGPVFGFEFGSPPFVLAALLHLIITGCYTCGYAGITEYSPSAEVLLAVREHMPEGVPAESLRVKSFTEYSLTGKRIDHLVGSGMATIEGGQVRLTKLGRMAVGVSRCYRVFLGVDPIGRG